MYAHARTGLGKGRGFNMLPITRADWDRERLFFGELYKLSQADAVAGSANWLIERLYSPDTVTGCAMRRLPKRLATMRHEPINFGDLSARAIQQGAAIEVVLEEAGPDSCPTLCTYVADWLRAWGWVVVVRTEW